jgi:hypothetical protein
VTAGGVNELTEAQLTLVGHAGLAAKSGTNLAKRPPELPPAHLDLNQPLADQPAQTRKWAKVGALVAAGIAASSFALAIKYARDVNDLNGELDPYRRFNCADGTPGACQQPAGTDKVVPLTPREVEYVKQLQDEAKRYDNYQTAALGLSVVALAASAPFFYFWLRGEPEAAGGPRVSLTPLLAPGQAGMGAQLRF